MMRKLRILSLLVLFGFTTSYSQIANQKEAKLHVYGNCGMCKKTIEKAANFSPAVKATWNKETKMLEVAFDSTKTSEAEILKKVADAGYDNEKFTAPDKVYDKLPGCCQYDRPVKKD